MKIRYSILMLLIGLCFTSSGCRQVQNSVQNYLGEQTLADSLALRISFSDAGESFRSYKLRKNESISVFVKENGRLIANNERYTNDKGEKGLFIPEDSSKRLITSEHPDMTIAAIYPYRENYTHGPTIDIDLRKQSDGKDKDLITGITDRDQSYEIQFKHRLSALDFILEGVSEAHEIRGTVRGAKSVGVYDIFKNEFSDTEKKEIETALYAQKNIRHLAAYIIPSDNRQSLSLLIKVDGKARTCSIPAQTFQPGRKYTFRLKLKGDRFVTDQIAYLEMPVVPKASNYIFIQHYEPLEDENDSPENKNVRNYAYLYDTKLKMALWVAYPLHTYYLGDFSRGSRRDPWHCDLLLGEHFQDVVTRGYRSEGTRCDRGHQLPSADRTKNAAYNRTTYTSANCTAQFSKFNQGVWEGLERRVRNYQKTLSGTGLDTLYVVTGAGIGRYPGMPQVEQPKVIDAQNHKVTVPTYYYKALAIRTKGGGFQTMAFILPNDPNIKKKDYNNYRISVSQLEKYTGFTFFPGIPNEAKQSDSMKGW